MHHYFKNIFSHRLVLTPDSRVTREVLAAKNILKVVGKVCLPGQMFSAKYLKLKEDTN